jgi:SlyX protein
MSTPTPSGATEAHTEDRITQLEIKLSYAEDLLDTLNTLVTQQQDRIDWLLREVHQLRRQREDDAPGAFRSLRDELPPHY